MAPNSLKQRLKGNLIAGLIIAGIMAIVMLITHWNEAVRYIINYLKH